MGDISIFDLKAAQDRVKTPYFIETGTLYGDGVEFAYKQGFEEIHSIEIEPFLAQQAKEKFKACRRSFIFYVRIILSRF